VVCGKHSAKRLDGIALTVLLRQLSHAHFSEIALDCLLEERFALLILRSCVGN
jgi:hypothetical protein